MRNLIPCIELHGFVIAENIPLDKVDEILPKFFARAATLCSAVSKTLIFSLDVAEDDFESFSDRVEIGTRDIFRGKRSFEPAAGQIS